MVTERGRLCDRISFSRRRETCVEEQLEGQRADTTLGGYYKEYMYITIRSLFRVERQEDTVCEVPRTQVSFILLVDFEYRRWADSSNFCCWG
ncbi:hypothetical protein Naga_100384g2 [Nannochloropsis gaditana]|uniref:Uncharacterized protein n=1 Tax=Nannochloropsis gaditana TaxID=72520 RepID=W7TSC0_9STRA|nr:hypothetical protein Naga_100384g2 [Nannochloropsis gaditana]